MEVDFVAVKAGLRPYIETKGSATLFIQWRVCMSKQPRYSKEFQERAVRRMKLGDNVSQLSRELGVHRTCLYRWKRQPGLCPQGRIASRCSEPSSSTIQQWRRHPTANADRTFHPRSANFSEAGHHVRWASSRRYNIWGMANAGCLDSIINRLGLKIQWIWSDNQTN